MAITKKKEGFPKHIKPEKRKTVDFIKENIEKAQLAVFAQFQTGSKETALTANDFTQLRLSLKEKGGRVFVARNTLSRIAVKEMGLEIEDKHFTGGNLWIFAYEDPVELMKALDKFWGYLRKNFGVKEKVPKPKFGIMDGKKVITEKQVEEIAKLPPKEVMIATTLATMKAPITNFVWVLKNTIAKIVWALNEIKEKKEKGEL